MRSRDSCNLLSLKNPEEHMLAYIDAACAKTSMARSGRTIANCKLSPELRTCRKFIATTDRPRHGLSVGVVVRTCSTSNITDHRMRDVLTPMPGELLENGEALREAAI